MWKLEGIQEERERAERMLAEERKRTEKAKKEAEKAKKEAESSKKMMAKAMLSSGVSIEEVAKVSGFSIGKLRKIN